MTGDALTRVLARLPRARKSGPRWMFPCPAHQDGTASGQLAQGDGRALLHCFAGCSVEAIVAALNLELADLFDDKGERDPFAWQPAPAPVRPVEREAPKRPEGAADLWARCSRVWDSPAACAWLRSRGIDPAAVEDADLARALPATGALPSWATFQRRTWRETGHLLVVPMFDHLGELVSLHSRYIGDGATDAPKSLTPAGSSNRGAVMADALGRLLLAGEAAAWPHLRVVVVEGVPDHLAAAAQASDADEDAPAVVGIVSGSWSAEIASRIPPGTAVALATDPDEAGEKYAQEIAATLAGRVVRRWRPRGVAA